MPIQTRWWDESRHIIVFKFSNPWTLPEFLEADERVGAEVKTFDHIVDAIFDIQEASIFPKNMLSSFMRAARQTEAAPNQGITVVVGRHALIEVLVNAIIQMTRQQDKIFLTSDMAAALQKVEAKQQERAAQVSVVS
jgi:hypothetical protein